MKPGQMARGTHLQLGLTDTDGVDLPIFAGKHRALSPARSLWGPWGHLTRLRMSSAVLAGFVGLGLACCPGLAAADATVPPKAATTGGLYPGAIALEPETAPETAPEASAPLEPAEPIYLRPQNACPAELEPLLAGLLRDLPSYANRVARRSLGVNEGVAGYGTLLLAGRAEFEPLDISDRRFGSSSGEPDAVRQVFFTTLERQYTATEQIHLQQFHWLFITLGSDGWYPVAMFSRLGVDPVRETALRPPTPPQESSDSVVGQAVRLWLRDCRAGAVYPVEASDLEAVGIGETVPEPSVPEATGR
jgi:hypothetical protein